MINITFRVLLKMLIILDLSLLVSEIVLTISYLIYITIRTHILQSLIIFSFNLVMIGYKR